MAETNKPKVIGGTELVFCEDTNYKTQLWKQHNLEKVLDQRLKLYKVVLADESVVFCLAESPQGAIGQAACKQGLGEIPNPLEAKATALLVENFKIRGWGSTNFNAD